MQSLGYQRTLQATDLWKMDESREAGVLGDKLDQAWARRVKAANEWNARLAAGDIKPSLYKRTKWSAQALRGKGTTYGERRIALEEQWRAVGGRKEPSLAWALNDVFGRDFWFGGAFKVIGDTSQLMGPVLAKVTVDLFFEVDWTLTPGCRRSSILGRSTLLRSRLGRRPLSSGAVSGWPSGYSALQYAQVSARTRSVPPYRHLNSLQANK